MNTNDKDHLNDAESDSETESGSASAVTVEEVSANDGDDEIQVDDDDDDGIILSEIRKGTKNIALYSVMGLCISMALLSLSYLYQFQARSKDRDYENIESSSALPFVQNNICQSESSNRSFWQDLLENQIDVLQNLVHASLLGGAVTVAAIRGDAVWFYFSRNVTFFFCPVAWAYVITDLKQMVRYNDADPYMLRFTLAVLMAVTSTVALWKLESTRQLVWRGRCYQYDAASLSHHESNDDGDDENSSTGTEFRLARTIYSFTWLLQFNALAYVVITTYQWFRMQVVCDNYTGYDNGMRRLEGVMDEEQHHGSSEYGGLLPFEMAYGLGAHESFLLALLLLVATYPKDAASIGGCILCSSWRLVVACGSLVSIFYTEIGSASSNRTRFALFYTTAEIVAILPILISSLLLFSIKINRFSGARNNGYHVIEPQRDSTTPTQDGHNDQWTRKPQDEGPSLERTVGDRSLTDKDPDCKDDEESHHIKQSLTFYCPTLRRIYMSQLYSNKQRKGAKLLWWGSVALIIEMTLESAIQLRQSVIGTDMSHEIYKWGMHICSIFSFCVVMSVETPSIYHRARWLLTAACPLGSFLALWQLHILVEASSGIVDVVSGFIAALLVARAVGGFIQCAGLLYLRDTQPIGSVCVPEVTYEQEHHLKKSMRTTRFVLFYLYIPAFALYVFGFAILGNCSEPMISSTIPLASCAGSEMDFMLAQNWLGLGLFFHFGMLVVMFAADGLNENLPSYKPSLLIATFFSAHVALLIAIHFVWNVMKYDQWTLLSAADIIRRLLLLLWMTTSGCLSLCVYKHWTLRTSTSCSIR